MSWLVEEGIGEERAIRIEGGQLTAARLHWPGRLSAGQVEDAILVSRTAGSRRGTARFSNGEEALVDTLPPSTSEGAPIRLEVTRSAIAERHRGKLARARPTDKPCAPAPGLAAQLRAEAQEVQTVRRFPDNQWEELWQEAWQGAVAFDGGELAFSCTPAMTLIDIDGSRDPRGLALAAVPAVAASLRRFDIAGNIGIDFPTLAAKADRQAVDAALEEALAGWPHERTAMNGFGFVQIVSRQQRPSLLQRIAMARVGAAARMLLRRGEMLEGAGALLLSCHPALKAKLRAEWLEELERRTGREARIETDPTLAIEAGQAQLVPR